MLQFSQFVWPLSYSVWGVFSNFLLIDATDRSKISSDQKRFFYRIKPIPPFIFREHSLLNHSLPKNEHNIDNIKVWWFISVLVINETFIIFSTEKTLWSNLYVYWVSLFDNFKMQKFFCTLSKTLQLNNIKFFLILIILIIYVITSYDQNISLIFYVKDGSHARLWHPYSCVYIRAQRQYTAVQKIRKPLKYLSLHYNLDFTYNDKSIEITPAVRSNSKICTLS